MKEINIQDKRTMGYVRLCMYVYLRDIIRCLQTLIRSLSIGNSVYPHRHARSYSNRTRFNRTLYHNDEALNVFSSIPPLCWARVALTISPIDVTATT